MFDSTSSWPACQVHLEQKNHLKGLNNFDNSDCSGFIAKLERLGESFMLLCCWCRVEGTRRTWLQRELWETTLANQLLTSLCRSFWLSSKFAKLKQQKDQLVNCVYLTILWHLDNSVTFGFVCTYEILHKLEKVKVSCELEMNDCRFPVNLSVNKIRSPVALLAQSDSSEIIQACFM